MFSDVSINEEMTKATFGYNSTELSEGSHKKVVVVCNNCQRQIHKEFRNRNSKHQCPIVCGETKRCFKCQQWKDISLFNKCSKLSGGVSKMCRECHNTHASVVKCETRRKARLRNAIENGDIEYYIQRRVFKVKRDCKVKGIAFDIDSQYLIDLWKQQDGKCFYTNKPMTKSMKQEGFQAWDCPSLDRLEPSSGYVKGNLVWCIFSVNSFKQSLNLDQFKEALESLEWWYRK